MEVDVNKLKSYDGNIYNDGYRLVYRKNNELLYGSYTKEIEGFIYETYPYNPYPYYINDEEIVFTTVEDLLEGLLKIDSNKDIDEVLIYKVNGELIASKEGDIMHYELVKVKLEDKDKLYRLLQYALYDGSFYIDNDIDEDCKFKYGWFDNYFTDDDRDAYFIKDGNNYLGMVMVNENTKFNETGKCISEFFVLPKYRRNHIGARVAHEIFDMYKGDWEVQPMENNPIAYSFWKNTVNNYTNGDYTIKNDGIEDVFMFKSRKK